MCELFGVSGVKKSDCRRFLREFYSHGREHPHGWGIALIEGNSVRMRKEPVCSLESTFLKKRLSSPIRSNLLLAHIRLATKGSIEYKNTHPFILADNSGRTWTLEHNGTIFESGVLSGYVRRQDGSTDSERILCYLVDRMNRAIQKKKRRLTDEERAQVVEDVIYTVTPENKVNLIVSDGELLYVHTNYKGSLHRHEDEERVVFSTKPLTENHWEELALNTLYVYRKNVLIYEGIPHTNEFFDSEEKMRLLFLDFAEM